MAFALALFLLLPATPAAAGSDGMVRVKLTRLGAPAAIVMQANCDYYLASDPSVRVPADTPIKLAAEGGSLTLMYGEAVVPLGGAARLMRARAGACGMRFGSPELSNVFCGDLFLSASDGVITTVLNIYVEDYLYGVVGYEMPPSSGIEALKAQAVAARSYALRRKASRGDAAYHLTDTASDQVFRGYSASEEHANVVKAVDGTRGGVLCYGNALAACFYTASNGGQTESTRNAWGGALAYSRVQDDPYDYEGAGVKKTASLRKDARDLDASLRAALVKGMAAQLEKAGCGTDAASVRIDAIESIEPERPRYDAPSRLYRALAFRLRVTGTTAGGRARSGRVRVSVPTYGGLEAWYGLDINEEDNETVWVTETDETFEIAFRRKGHGVGMSQRGAQVMAAKYGWSCLEILAFYYPGTTPKRLALEDATRDAGSAPAAPETRAPTRAPIATARMGARTELLDAAVDDAGSVAALAAGATVEVYAVRGAWAAVGSSGKYGFVPTDALTGFALCDAAAVRAPEGAAARVTEAATLRQLPVAEAEPLGRLEAGESLGIVAYTSEWALVESAAGRGFVEVTALDRVDAGSGTEAEADDGGEIKRVSGEKYLYVTARSLKLYARDAGDAEVLATLGKGERVQVGAYNDKWACVRAGDQTGFVLRSGLGVEAPAAGIDGGAVKKVEGKRYARAARDGVIVYDSWDTGAESVAVLAEGERVRVGAYNGKWACVRAGDVKGFVLISDLKKDG